MTTTSTARVVLRARRNWMPPVLIILVLVAGGAPAMAARSWFDLPPGFKTVTELDRSEDAEWHSLATVRPDDGPFSNLSAIHLRAVTGAVDDPDAWLTRRLTGDVGDGAAAEDLLGSPDSPFGDPAFDVLRDAVPTLFKGLEALSKLPLEFCEGPNAAYNAAGDMRELYCVYQVGPFRQYLILRLQEVDGLWYFTEIKAMNERRLRHLIAIANSFRPAR
ncbi:MAG: hypothetical protein IPM60_11130 [Rhodospirillales bacterium]|nr:hypothetical protein [Rhodospirillales bacterium]